ncbi:MAG: hypothetical protein ABIK65_12945 [Candidatus Eisenbacteria bacterium]
MADPKFSLPARYRDAGLLLVFGLLGIANGRGRLGDIVGGALIGMALWPFRRFGWIAAGAVALVLSAMLWWELLTDAPGAAGVGRPVMMTLIALLLFGLGLRHEGGGEERPN